MKKIILMALASTVAMSAAQAADYPDTCAKLEDLSLEMAELLPEMKEQLDAMGSAEERKAMARAEWEKLSESEQTQAAAVCEAGIAQAEQAIEQLKAQKAQ